MKKPRCTRAAIAPTATIDIRAEGGASRAIEITAEYPLTLYLDKQELVTLMTLGRMPEALAVGWLRNQSIIRSVSQLESVQVDWDAEAVSVRTRPGEDINVDDGQPPRVVTAGCGQNTMLENLLRQLDSLRFERRTRLGAGALFALVAHIRTLDTVYKRSGAVHGCLLAEYSADSIQPLLFVEDIGRHNAVDAIAGWMWLNDVDGGDKVFYTTGRLTSEMVIKCAQMGIPYLVSRSGTTMMGHSIAAQAGITMIGRALASRYIVFTGAEHFDFDAPPLEAAALRTGKARG